MRSNGRHLLACLMVVLFALLACKGKPETSAKVGDVVRFDDSQWEVVGDADAREPAADDDEALQRSLRAAQGRQGVVLRGSRSQRVRRAAQSDPGDLTARRTDAVWTGFEPLRAPSRPRLARGEGAHQLGHVADAQLLHPRLERAAHRRDAHAELVGDELQWVAERAIPQDLALA